MRNNGGKMKKNCRIFGFIALAALLWFSVSACGDDSNSTPEPEPLPTYGISLVQVDGSAFTDGTYTFGTGDRAPLSVTVKNTGTAATGRLSIAKIGGNPGNFNLSSSNSIESIPKGGSAVFTVQVIGTLTGDATYTTKIQISGDNDISENLVVSFTESSGPVYGIALMGNNMPLGSYTFTARTSLTVQVVNSGNTATGQLNIAKGGDNPNDFTVFPTSLSDIGVGGRTTFTVIPNDNLSNGIHSATITVTGGNNITRSFTVIYIPTVIPGDPTAFEGSWYSSRWTETFTFHIADGVGTFTKMNDEGWGERGTFTCTETTFTCVITEIYDGGSWGEPKPNATLIWPRTYKFEGGSLLINDEHVYIPKAAQPGNEPYPHTGGNAPYRILAIGNSYSQDSMRYMRDILIANGADNNDIVIVNAYVGGQNLAGHAANARSDSPAYERQSFGKRGEITSQYGVVLKDIITSSDWDYITLQQASVSSGKPDTYNDDLTYLIQYVKENATNPAVKIGWHMTWAYQGTYADSSFDGYGKNQMTMYNAITDTVQAKIVPVPDFEFIIPTGTAVQNARTLYGDTLNSDGTHLNDRGRFIAATMWVLTIYNKDIGVFTSDYKALNNFTITLDDMAKIKKCVQDAFEHPFAVTDQQ
jgi:hypothetical protein